MYVETELPLALCRLHRSFANSDLLTLFVAQYDQDNGSYVGHLMPGPGTLFLPPLNLNTLDYLIDIEC